MNKHMVVDKNRFFREASLLICGTLDFELALKNCLNYLKRFMPADMFLTNIIDQPAHAIKTIAIVTPTEAKKANINFQIDDFSWKFIQQKNEEKAYILNPAEVQSLKNTMSRLEGLSNPHSVMVIHLEISNSKVGNLILIAYGKNRFNIEHLKLYSILKEPFSIALLNALRYYELEQLKEILADDVQYLHQKLRDSCGDKIIGVASGLRKVMELVKSVAPAGSPVLLMGETGVGKEVIANAIHALSRRRDAPFIAINCGAIPEALIDSELFGHEKGAFTGAVAQRRGCFERAHGGTIFLDEIGELPLQAQVRMLRVLQEKKIVRVGGSKHITVNIRIIAATHQNLKQMVKQNLFRSDLHFRLNVFPIAIPPLRERKEDIPKLVNHFINKKAKEMLIPHTPKLSPEASFRLMTYDWPGNVRELENVIERALILSENGLLTMESILSSDEIEVFPSALENKFWTLDQMNSLYIQHALALTKGRVHGPKGAAKLLGINPSTLRSRMKKLGI